MFRNLIISFLFLATAPAAANAQGTLKIKHIHQLMDEMGVTKMGPKIFSAVLDQFSKTTPNMDSTVRNELMKEANFDQLVEMIVPVYDKNFSDDDILQLLAFYRSPIGKKFVEKTPEVTQESFQIGMEWGKKISENVMQRLKEKGYMKSS